jgi:hypothetical protein
MDATFERGRAREWLNQNIVLSSKISLGYLSLLYKFAKFETNRSEGSACMGQTWFSRLK